MSTWSFVSGIIEVETFSRTTAEAMYIAQTVVSHLPKIHGSERCVSFYLNELKGFKNSSDADEFDNRSNLMRGENECNLFEWQPNVLITLNGALRDASYECAIRDTTKMLARLSSRLWVKSCLISVSSDERKFVFCDPKWVLNRELSEWVNKKIRPKCYLD